MYIIYMYMQNVYVVYSTYIFGKAKEAHKNHKNAAHAG